MSDVSGRERIDPPFWMPDTVPETTSVVLQQRMVSALAASPIDDFSEGSVISMLLATIASELELAYARIQEAYDRAFLETATGGALDKVVALVGIGRRAATSASGEVVFFRRNPPSAAVTVAKGTRVADRTGRALYATTTEVQIPASTISERVTIEEVGAGADRYGVVRLGRRAGKLETLDGHEALARPGFGDDDRTVTLEPGGWTDGDSVEAEYWPISASAPVTALRPGPDANVAPGAISVMPSPPAGISGVVNEEAFTNGIVAETDEELRGRARAAVATSGRATRPAIARAVLRIEGVTDVRVTDWHNEAGMEPGIVRVRYSTIVSESERQRVHQAVIEAVEENRAAGILPMIEVVTFYEISGDVFIFPSAEYVPGHELEVVARISDAVNGTSLGEPLSLKRLAALCYGLPGLAEVARLRFVDQGGGTVPDPVVQTERSLRAGVIQPVVLAALNLPSAEMLLVTRQVNNTTVWDLRTTVEILAGGTGVPAPLDLALVAAVAIESRPASGGAEEPDVDLRPTVPIEFVAGKANLTLEGIHVYDGGTVSVAVHLPSQPAVVAGTGTITEGT